MPRIVCVTCWCEFRLETSGTTVVEMASSGPYKVWDGDTWKCPGCGVEVVCGFGSDPVREDHYAGDFGPWLTQYLKHARRVEYDYERPQHVVGGETVRRRSYHERTLRGGIINLKNLSKLNPAIANHPFWMLAMEQLENGVKTLYKED